MKTDRLIGILTVLLQKDKVTAPYLAEKFEVSRRTINRDIETLCKSGIPVAATQGKNGGIYIMDGYKIDKTLLTSSEMQSIIAGLKGLDSVCKTNKYKNLMEKLSEKNQSVVTADNHIFIDLSSWYKNTLAPKIELIQTAINKKRKIVFTYFSPKGETKRKINPYMLVFQWSSWYVWGHCDKRKDLRMFKLNRIVNLSISEDSFSEIKEIPSYTPVVFDHQPSEISATILFSEDVKWRIIDHFGIENISVSDRGNTITHIWTDKESLFEFLLSFGTSAELLEPENLRKEFKETTEKITEKYL
ncbi:MAG: YafY family transcriptional regulator [Ruminococcus sp.]|nr:YafY family transcriptional regulator [Ruminococcus sp.]